MTFLQTRCTLKIMRLQWREAEGGGQGRNKKNYIEWILDSPLRKMLWNVFISHWLSLRDVDGSCAEDFIQVLCDAGDCWWTLLWVQLHRLVASNSLLRGCHHFVIAKIRLRFILGLHRMPVKFCWVCSLASYYRQLPLSPPPILRAEISVSQNIQM